MGLGGEGGAACAEEGDHVANRAEKLSREAVSHVFTTLCGKSDAPDKFTGMQREMNMYIKRTIEAAIEAGQESGKKELAREQYRTSKAMEQLQANFKAKVKESEERRVAELVARVDCMCNALAAQKEEFEHNLKEFDRASKVMAERATLHEKQGKDWAAQMAALRRQADESQAQAESALREADRERRAAVVLQDKLDALQCRLADEEAAMKNVSKRWSDDVELMQSQLQKEVEARIAAEQRLLEVNSGRCRDDDTHQEESAPASTNANREDQNALCTKCQAHEELVSELQSAVTLLNEQLSSVYREKAAVDKEREREHAKAVAAVRDEMSAQLTAARDAQAFAEKVAKRLENELLKQSHAILQQQHASRQQASGLKRRMGGGKPHTEFKDFSAEVERLTGGGRSRVPSEGLGAHTPREPADLEPAQAQLPSMPPANSSLGLLRPPSGRLGGGASGGVTGQGGEVRLGEIRRPTPPIGASGNCSRTGQQGGRGGKACPSLNLANIDRHGGCAAGAGVADGAAMTERAVPRGGLRQDGHAARVSARHLLPSTAR